MARFNYKQTGRYHQIIVIALQCTNFEHMVYSKMAIRNNKDHIMVFINYIVFQHVGISWFIQTQENNDFYFDKKCPLWIQAGI